MDTEPKCIACNVDRSLIGVMPVRNRHEMLSYECPNCRSIFRLVVRRKPRLPAEGSPTVPRLAAGR